MPSKGLKVRWQIAVDAIEVDTAFGGVAEAAVMCVDAAGLQK